MNDEKNSGKLGTFEKIIKTITVVAGKVIALGTALTTIISIFKNDDK